MNFTYSLENTDSKYSERFKIQQDIYNFKIQYRTSEDTQIAATYEGLKEMLDKLTQELKDGLHPENDCIGLSLRHPDLIAESIDVPFQRPKNLTGELVFTHIGKAVQSQHSILLDGKMQLCVTVAKGTNGSG